MRFSKMHGAGNDYVFVECFTQPIPADPSSLTVSMSDRHFGIGADGLILLLPSHSADACMRMFNADGSEAEMCGNGIRCVGKLLYERGIVRRDEMCIETDAGRIKLQLDVVNGRVDSVSVDMGRPILESRTIPTTLPGNPPLDVPLVVAGKEWTVCAVSMGNPHCVLFVPELTDELVHQIGPQIEHCSQFPQRVNVEFVRIDGPNQVSMRVWERGSGETKACGTGACAAVVAGVLTGRLDRRVECELPGGVLTVEWPDAKSVFLTGPAVEVFQGDWQ